MSGAVVVPVVVAVVAVAVAAVAAAVARRRAGQRDRLALTVERLAADGGERQAELARLKAAVEALPLGVVVADQLGAVVLCSAAADHFAGTHHADALVTDAVRGMLERTVAEGPLARTLELYGPPRRSVEVRTTPFPGGALAVIEDVSERVRLEETRTDFVANVSHELKTPVGALAVLAETMAAEDDAAVTRRLAERMVSEAHRVGRIIDDLLELSRIEVGEPPPHQPVRVSAVVAEAVERVRPLCEARDANIAVDHRMRRLEVCGDQRQLVAAVANLLENGVKYSDKGATVEVAASAEGGQWVDVVVRDHGIGIPRRDLERVFERFYRVDRARSRETGGTGLGLAIVRHVATNHGGSVSVQSQEGVGSTFTLRLPAVEGPGSP